MASRRSLSDSTSPLHLLATKAGVSPLGVAIDFGAMVSMFACVLACATAAARVLDAHGARRTCFPLRLSAPISAITLREPRLQLSAALMFAATAVLAFGRC